MRTKLQKKYASCKVLQRGFMEFLAAEGVPLSGSARLWRSVIKEVFQEVPEAQIKFRLYCFMQCYDLSQEEKLEILQLLRQPESALTRRQRQQIQEYLQYER